MKDLYAAPTAIVYSMESIQNLAVDMSFDELLGDYGQDGKLSVVSSDENHPARDQNV